jgi:hypothetical protein
MQSRVILLGLLTVFGIAVPGNLHAQWSSCTGGICYTAGDVGVGTSTPAALLDVNGVFRSTGYSAPTSGVGVEVTYSTAGAAGYLQAFDRGAGVWKPQHVRGNPLILNDSGAGNVGIGTTSPIHLLQVAGTIGAEEVIVSSTGADYVFDPKYKLAPLTEVATYVEDNHHLPGIPSAEEMTKQGVSLGEMQTKLLAKVEELTLHMIEAEKNREQLDQQNRELQRQVNELREKVSEIQK